MDTTVLTQALAETNDDAVGLTLVAHAPTDFPMWTDLVAWSGQWLEAWAWDVDRMVRIIKNMPAGPQAAWSHIILNQLVHSGRTDCVQRWLEMFPSIHASVAFSEAVAVGHVAMARALAPHTPHEVREKAVFLVADGVDGVQDMLDAVLSGGSVDLIRVAYAFSKQGVVRPIDHLVPWMTKQQRDALCAHTKITGPFIAQARADLQADILRDAIDDTSPEAIRRM